MKLSCIAQNYKWGKVGNNSLVGKIVKKNNANSFDESKEYAEYWMGTHINGPSSIKESLIENNVKESLLSDYLCSKYLINQLPFLFKVLSISKPLSIQVHPDKITAEELNKKLPNTYKDNRNKPELAIIISDNFSMLYGIKSPKVFSQLKKSDKEIFKLIASYFLISKNGINIHNNDLVLKEDDNEDDYILSDEVYLKLINYYLLLSNDCLIEVIDKLLKIIDSEKNNETELGKLIKLLFNEFSYDRGVIFSLFMVKLDMKKGDSIFIADNIPHCYIEGEIMECMVNSDFVIRLGLTPKETDIENFINILNSKFSSLLTDFTPKTVNFHSIEELDKTKVFYKFPSFEEFFVIKIGTYIKGDDLGIKSTLKIINHTIMFVLKTEEETQFEIVLNEKLVRKNIESLEAVYFEPDTVVNIIGSAEVYFATFN